MNTSGLGRIRKKRVEAPARTATGCFAGPLAAAACVVLLCPAALAQSVQNVTINTSAVNGKPGRIVFDYVTSNGEQGASTVIRNFSAPQATLGLPSSTGGLITGDIILGTNPASQTEISTDYFGQGATFTELVVNFTKFSNSVTFSIQFPTLTPAAGSPPDQASFFILDGAGNPWFNTGDPLGANALFTYDVTGTNGVLKLFAPATSPSSGNISIVLPPNNTTGLSVNRTTLNFGAAPVRAPITSSQTVFVQVPAGVAWSATSDQSYVVVAPAGSTGSGNLTVSVIGGALPGTGPLTANVTVMAGTTNSPQVIHVNINYSASNVLIGSFDTPVNLATGVAGAIPVTGWALDNIEITNVDIWREPVIGEAAGLVFIGNAVLVADARPDVQATYPSAPYSYRAGWGYLMLTNFLPPTTAGGQPGNGVYKIHAIAHNATGFSLDLGTKSITVDNAHAAKPFGTIDTPAQGGTAAGSQFVNFGWALTQSPNCIPTDGSTITVQIDGVAVAHPVYNQFRSDIATFFPGRCNTPGPVGYYIFNTTTLSNGVHTIAWVAFDNQNHGDGLGSRYFNVFNTSGPSAPPDLPLPPEFSGTVTLRRGYDAVQAPEPVGADDRGWRVVEAEELDRIEMDLGAVDGYSVANADRTPLPPGSTLKDGVFYWQLGPGFRGSYYLIFQQPGGKIVPVNVRVRPKNAPRRTYAEQ